MGQGAAETDRTRATEAIIPLPRPFDIPRILARCGVGIGPSRYLMISRRRRSSEAEEAWRSLGSGSNAAQDRAWEGPTTSDGFVSLFILLILAACLQHRPGLWKTAGRDEKKACAGARPALGPVISSTLFLPYSLYLTPQLSCTFGRIYPLLVLPGRLLCVIAFQTKQIDILKKKKKKKKYTVRTLCTLR
jgi:hypothetical protein